MSYEKSSSHKVVITEVVFVRVRISNGSTADTSKGGFALGSLRLLAALFGSLLLLQLLVAQGRQGAGNLLDLSLGRSLESCLQNSWRNRA